MLTPSVSKPLTPREQVAASIPPEITAYDLVELDPLALRAEVEAGNPITLPFGDQQFELKLVFNDLLSSEYRAEVPPEVANVGTYRGKVVGDPDSWVRLSLRTG